MRLWKHRPLFAAACVFMGAALAGFFLTAEVKGLLMGLCLVSAVLLATALLIRRRKKHSPVPSAGLLAVCLLLCSALALGQSYLTIDRTEKSLAAYEGQVCTVEATVLECKSSGGHMSTFVLSVEAVNGQTADHNALLTCYYVSDLRPGHRISIQAEAVSLSEAAGDIYEEYHLMGEGIFCGYLSMQELDCTIISETPDTLSLRLADHHFALSLDMERLFGDTAAGLPSALLLGERDHLPDEVRRDFARTGVSHLLAISGLHMTLLFGMLAGLLKLFRLPPRGRAIILCALAFAYLIYLGFPPSATRAIIMLGMTYLAGLCFANADPLTSLGLAGMVILLISPTTVADVGFWMSFSATLGLLVIMPLLPSVKKKGVGRLLSWLSGLGAGIAAVTFSLWITVPAMGEMSLLSAPMTLLLTPLTGLLLILVPFAMLTAATPVGTLLVSAVQGISSLMVGLCQTASTPSWTVISLQHPAIPYAAAVMILSTLLLLGLSLPRKRVALIPLAAGWVVIAILLTGHSLRHKQEIGVSYLVSSTTSEMLVMTRGQEAVICELSGGSSRAFLSAANEAARRGATELSAFILTDYHSATSGTLLQLARREMIRSVWMPKPTCEEDYYLMLACLEAAERTDTPAVIYEYGEELTLFGEASLSVERSALKRSVQPVLLLTLTTPAEQMTVCGRSILESELALSALTAMGESETVILSNKGPVLKQGMEIPWTPQVTSVYFANKTVAAYLSPSHYPREDVRLTVGQGRFRIRLSS